MVDGLALSEAVQTTFITSGTATLLAMMIGSRSAHGVHDKNDRRFSG